MKLRTFLYVLVSMGAAYAIITLFVANRDVLVRREFHFWGGVDLPVGLTLILFLVAGVAITLLAGLTREASKMMEGWRLKRTSRRGTRSNETRRITRGTRTRPLTSPTASESSADTVVQSAKSKVR